MAHLIGPDSLPSKDQLDSSLVHYYIYQSYNILFKQFLPHLSSPQERAFVVLNNEGDFGIVKGKWTGFNKKV